VNPECGQAALVEQSTHGFPHVSASPNDCSGLTILTYR
jgi:hypothetical protein